MTKGSRNDSPYYSFYILHCSVSHTADGKTVVFAMIDAPVQIRKVVVQFATVCVATAIIRGRPEDCIIAFYVARIIKITVYDSAGGYCLES